MIMDRRVDSFNTKPKTGYTAPVRLPCPHLREPRCVGLRGLGFRASGSFYKATIKDRYVRVSTEVGSQNQDGLNFHDARMYGRCHRVSTQSSTAQQHLRPISLYSLDNEENEV